MDFIKVFAPLQSAKNRRSHCISHFCFKGVGGTHCLMIRPRPVKDYLKWVFCLHKAISKIHHFFNNHKVYVYTKMKFSFFKNIYRRLDYCWSFDFPSFWYFIQKVCELFKIPNLSNIRRVDCFKSKHWLIYLDLKQLTPEN